MFHSARLKLTTWYLLIIMLISISFSMAIFRLLSFEIDRLEHIQRLRIQHNLNQNMVFPPSNLDDNSVQPFFLDPDLIAETKNRVSITLVMINIGILGASAIAGYILAGRTLRPIQEMVNDQNQFITDASHELRTPLTSLKSEIEVNLRDNKLTLLEAKNILKSNLEEVNHLQVLSDGLIKLTQYQKGMNGLIVENISLKDITNQAIRKVYNLAKYRKITIRNTISNIDIEANNQALTELFIIFLDNAIKYSPEKTKINISANKFDTHVIIKIVDQGYGIKTEDIPHLFDRFYRADKSRTKSNIPGYGLGLSIAKQIIDKHHGTIVVESQINKGTTFNINLPVKHEVKHI
jgi:two-component system, OmpR family, sensor histidine kinase CiaH